MNRTPERNFRDERLDVLAGTRGSLNDRAVRLHEMRQLVTDIALDLQKRAAVAPAAAIPDVPTAGLATAADNADAINAVLTVLRARGLVAP
jgi:hypothetical protein